MLPSLSSTSAYPPAHAQARPDQGGAEAGQPPLVGAGVDVVHFRYQGIEPEQVGDGRALRSGSPWIPRRGGQAAERTVVERRNAADCSQRSALPSRKAKSPKPAATAGWRSRTCTRVSGQKIRNALEPGDAFTPTKHSSPGTGSWPARESGGGLHARKGVPLRRSGCCSFLVPHHSSSLGRIRRARRAR